MKRNYDLGLLVIRISIGFLMLLHGINKLQGIGPIEGMLKAKGLPSFFAYGVYIGEIVAPLLIIVGYRTRLASLLFSINVGVATYLAHAKDIFSINKFGGWEIELLGLYFFGAIALILMGGGRLALSKSKRWD